MSTRWRALGDGALSTALPPNVAPEALLALLRSWPRVTDAVLTEDDACIYFDPRAAPDEPDLGTVPDATATVEPRVVTIHARYDGPDLAEVAAHAELTIEETIARHVAGHYGVAMLGFLPGFAYLRGVDPRIDVPRRSVPRARVSAGSIGLAAGYTGVYPFACPGGWNLIATAVDFAPFDRERGAALSVGDGVRFERAG
jgi:UPF0271 protein